MRNGYRTYAPGIKDLIKEIYLEHFLGNRLRELAITYDNGVPYLQEYWESNSKSSISIRHFLEIKSDY